MSSEFIARPPLFLGQGSQKGLARHLSRILRGFGRILFQTFVPFNPRPEEPADLSELAGEFDDDQLKQCEKIFDQIEGTRVQLEQKARSTFAVTSFLAPLLAAILLFLLAQTTPQTTSRTFAIVFAASSFIFLLLGFVTIMRAVSVQERQTLLHSAVIDFEKRQIREYNKTFHARGLLYCASANQAMNDHVAQFVKGAHILTAFAVLALVVAAMPAAFTLSNLPSTPVKAELIGSVRISSDSLTELQKSIAKVSNDLGILANDKSTLDWRSQLEARISQIEAIINRIQATQPVGPIKNGSKAK
jgi:hypothetical protein